jgi:carboxypeptidase C (cathepsin A)
MRIKLRLSLTLLASVCAAGVQAPAHAQPPINVTTAHEGTFGATHLRYTATVEDFTLHDGAGKPTASVTTTSYLRSDGNILARPVIFAFNGGPGSASLWLHMGLLGPRRVDFDDPQAAQTTAPFATLPNPDSPLDAADIVLIDPPGTGYSVILPDGKPEMFYGVQQDAAATVAVIEQWLARHGRMNAPKYLLSESYGTIRAAEVARMLAGGPMQTGNMDGVTLNGVILLGQSLDMARGGAGDDRAVLGVLPTLAVTACHFHKVAPDCTPQGQIAAANRFVEQSYLGALYAGSRLTPEQRAGVAKQLSALIGIPERDILARDLRISGTDFAGLLLRDTGQRMGMYDARFTLPATPTGDDPVADDPAMAQYVPGFVAAYDTYARQDLHIATDRPYQAISFRSINGRWDYGHGPGVPPSTNYAPDLAIAMTRNPHMRLLVGTGLYDLVTPLGSAEDTLAHAGVPMQATTIRTYPSGHMAYLGKEARQALVADIRAFVSVRP